MTIATLLAGVLVAGFLLPYSLGLGLASNRITNALAATPNNSLDGDFPERSVVTDNAGNPLAYLYNQNRIVVPLSAISPNLQVAIKVVEDKRFLTHKGVDWRGTVRALLRNTQSDQGAQGGSTLTQQYVKNYLFLVDAKTDAQRADAIAASPGRKLREAKLALTLEQKKTKDDILAGYLNLVAFLPSTYGAEATAQRLFGVHAADLTLPQAALMAGMVNNPNKYNPLDPDHAVDAKTRRDLVLKLLRDNLAITTPQMIKAQATPVDTSKRIVTPNGCVAAAGSTTNGYFCQYVLDYLTNAGVSADAVANGGYTIKTTLDPAVMKAAKAAVDKNADPNNKADIRVANVIAVLQPGPIRKVLALAANRPYGLDQAKGQSVQKLVTTFAPLGAGSTFKIFTAAAAIAAGLSPDAVIESPADYVSPLVPAHHFNNSGTYPATMTLTKALETSPNTAFVALEDQLGLSKVVDTAVAMGMKGYQLNAADVDQLFPGSTNTFAQEVVAQKVASFTLGVTPVSPLELAGVGATLSSDGLWCPPTPIDTVVDRNGKVIDLKTAKCVQAVPTGLARTLTRAMGPDVSAGDGTAHRAATTVNWSRYAAGKTGTTEDYKSSAYLGFTPYYSGAVLTWDYLNRPQSICINAPDQPNPYQLAGSCSAAQAKSLVPANKKIVGMSGGSLPAQTWFDTMSPLHQNLDNGQFPPSDPTYQAGLSTTQVPAMVGLQIDQAKALLAQKGFKGDFQIETLPTGAGANVVTRQNPQFSALPGATVTVWYSAGGTSGG